MVSRLVHGCARVDVRVIALLVVLCQRALGLRGELLRLPRRDLHDPRQSEPNREVSRM